MNKTPWFAAALVAAALFAAVRCDSGSGQGPSLTRHEPAYDLDLADFHLQHEGVDEAEALYEAVRDDAEDPALVGRATYGLFLVARKRGDLGAAESHVDAALERLPETNRPKLQLERADLLIDRGRPDEAETAIEAVLAKVPDQQIQAQGFQLFLKVYQGRLDQLATKLEERTSKEPVDRGWIAFLGDLYAEILSAPERAIVVYEKLLQREPANLVLLDRLFGLSMQTKDGTRAVKYGETLAGHLEREPRVRLSLLRQLASIHRGSSNYERARLLLGECERLAASDEMAELRAEIYAIRKLEGGLEEDVKKLEEAGDLGSLWLIHSRVDPNAEKALAVANKMVEKKPEDPGALICVVAAAGAREDHARVAEAASKLIAVAPSASRQAILPYAQAMGKLDKAAEAVETLTKAAEKEPSIRNLTCLASAGLQPDQRTAWLDKSLQAARDSGDAAICLETAEGLRSAGSPRGAFDAAQAGLALSPLAELATMLQWERVQDLEALGALADAEQACRILGEDRQASVQVRQLAERKLLELLQKQGKKIQIGPG